MTIAQNRLCPRALVLTAALLMGLAGCVEPTGGLLSFGALLVGPDTIDFGKLPVGDSSQKSIVLENPGPGAIEITGVRVGAREGDVDRAFSAQTLTVPVELLLGDTIEVTAAFAPVVASVDEVRGMLILQTNRGPHEVKLVGSGVRRALLVEPNPIDFGEVALGERGVTVVTMTNVSSVPLQLKTDRGPEGRPLLHSVRAEGDFAVHGTVDAAGFLDTQDELAPGAQRTIEISYTPKLDGFGGLDTAGWRVSGCDDDAGCEADVELAGTSPDAVLECTPEALDFGGLHVGEQAERTATCQNIGTRPVTIQRIVVGQIQSAAAFLLLRRSEEIVMAPGESIEIGVRFEPNRRSRPPQEYDIPLEVTTLNPITERDVRHEVRLRGRVLGPHIVAQPSPVDFELANVSSLAVRNLEVSNIGNERLDVSGMSVDVGNPMVFSIPNTEPFFLEPETSRTFEVRHFADQPGRYRSSVHFESNDPIEPELSVVLLAHAYDPNACMVMVEPESIAFGVVNLSGQPTAQVRVTNNGAGVCVFQPVALEGANIAEFELAVTEPQWSRPLASGDARVFSITLRPVSVGSKKVDIVLRSVGQVVRVPVTAQVQDAGAGIECSPPQTVLAGNTARVWVRDVSVTNYRWSIVDAPPGGIGTPNQWNPDPPNTTEVNFLAFIVGTYTLRVTATDANGDDTWCDTQVTAEGHGLRAQLTWDGVGDLDLHVLRTTGEPWQSTDDCYYGNRTPTWNAAYSRGEGPNPALDVDNRMSRGPENTNIDAPQDSMGYLIGVHHYSGGAGRTARIQVFCGGGVQAELDISSRAMAGDASGRCSGNDFWRVAEVTFTGTDRCIVRRLDEYITAAAACTAP